MGAGTLYVVLGCLTIQARLGMKLEWYRELREMASEHHNGIRFTNRGETESGVGRLLEKAADR
jgi:hypothetical protein